MESNYNKTYIQPSALLRLSDTELLEHINNGCIIQYGGFTPDIQMKINKII